MPTGSNPSIGSFDKNPDPLEARLNAEVGMLTDPILDLAVLQEADLRYVFEDAPVLALQVDAALQVCATNKFTRRMLGDGLLGRRFADLVVEFTPPPQVGGRGSPGDGQFITLQTSAGLPESFRFHYFELANGWIALGSPDIEGQLRLRNEMLGLNHELNDLTRQLHVANAELVELNQLKSRFIGMAAHDLRRPVGVIMTYGELILDDAGEQLSAENREFLERCLAAATGMKGVIDGFLDASAIEAGALRLDWATVTVAELLDGVMGMALLLARHKGVVLTVDPVDVLNENQNLHRLEADAGKVQQALLNLVGNAIEHSVAGQHVWLSAHRVGAELVLTVRDEGEGIAQDEQAKLFMPFVRAGTRKTAAERSTGLGLSIARLIAEAHGGRIWVKSEPGHGASFCIALPASRSRITEAAT